MADNAAKLFEEREKRISDAIALKVPDRVPIWYFLSFFSSICWHDRSGSHV